MDVLRARRQCARATGDQEPETETVIQFLQSRMHDLPGQSNTAAAMGTEAIARIEIPQPLQEPNRSHDSADGRYKKDEQKVPRDRSGHRVGKLHAAQHAMAE